ncbi:MAG TPA: hypothetical protein VLT62_19615 [Candidatus Methylomirabilis sp.]|nr:hypothetical protein [Candidatus Methylomirabilis sp.]
MGGPDSDVKQSISVDIGEDGVSATHPILVDFRHHVGTSLPDDKTRNTIREFLIVVGCATVPDAHFDFDSSFVRPEAKEQFIRLAKLRDDLVEPVGPPSGSDPAGFALTSPPLSIFGHADPTGIDAYNSTLSQRRARAIYAMLIRDVKEWEQLWSIPFGGDQWGDAQAATMQETVGITPPKKASLLTPAMRRDIIARYMDAVCVRKSGAGVEERFVLDAKADFLARGAGQSAKGDVQGCSEFNPAFLMSDTKLKEFEQAKDKPGRDAVNEVNRRVIAFLFKPGSKVNPKTWPCPHAKDPNAVALCKKRFWKDGETRRKPDSFLDREFRLTGDTFACRFYHGIAQNSPCEKAQKLWVMRILLSPPRTQVNQQTGQTRQVARPLVNRRFVLLAGDAPDAPQVRGRTSPEGVIRVPVFDEKTVMKLKLDTGRLLLPEGVTSQGEEKEKDDEAKRPEETFAIFELLAGDLIDMRLDAGGDEPIKQRLLNLGYGEPNIADWNEKVLRTATRGFQIHHRLSRTDGVIDEETRAKVREIHDTLPKDVVTDPTAP